MKTDSTHRLLPPNFEDMTEAEQDQWYVSLIEKTIDNATGSGSSTEWLHALFVIKDYVWYLKK